MNSRSIGMDGGIGGMGSDIVAVDMVAEGGVEAIVAGGAGAAAAGAGAGVTRAPGGGVMSGAVRMLDAMPFRLS